MKALIGSLWVRRSPPLGRMGGRQHSPWPGGRARAAAALVLVAFTFAPARTAVPRFFPDDPLAVDPETADASAVRPWNVSEEYDFIDNTFLDSADRTNVRASNVNTIDEVPDSSWFTNRIGARSMSVEEIVRGPFTDHPPTAGPWTIIAGKTEGITPGLTIRDSAGRDYFVKFDPPSNPEMATGAEVVTTRFFHALGFHVPENYLATLRPDDLRIDPAATVRGISGRKRSFTRDDLRIVLGKAAERKDGTYRVTASLRLSGKDLGPFRYAGTRPDDPNDIFMHEHRRELRGLRVFAAWLNHDDSRSINSRDFLVERDGRRIVWHYLIDFGSTLGSGSTQAQSPRAGNEYIWEARPTFITMLTLGLYVRPWLKVDYPEIPAVGRFEAGFFRPDQWKPEYPNPAFDNARPDDEFWAARHVLAFSDEAIAAVVKTGEYSDPDASAYLTQVLVTRRDKILQHWLNQVLPLVDLALSPDGTLSFRNIAIDAKAADAPTAYQVRWYTVDNAADAATPVGEAVRFNDVRVPAPAAVRGAEFVRADLTGMHPRFPGWATPLEVTFRRAGAQWQLVGLRRQPE
jgi:hypothetical protein